MTPPAIARLCGVHVRTAERWASGASAMPEPVRRRLWACQTHPELAAQILDGRHTWTRDDAAAAEAARAASGGLL